MTLGILLLIVYCALLLAGGIQDLVSFKISNWISVAVLIVCAVAVATQVPPSHWWSHGLAFALTLAGGTLLFQWGWLGGGDVKLLSASALWFDLDGLAKLLLAVAAIGGLLAFVIIVLRMTILGGGIARTGFAGVRRGAAVPYGVPIAIAAIALAVSGAIGSGGLDFPLGTSIT